MQGFNRLWRVYGLSAALVLGGCASSSFVGPSAGAPVAVPTYPPSVQALEPIYVQTGRLDTEPASVLPPSPAATPFHTPTAADIEQQRTAERLASMRYDGAVPATVTATATATATAAGPVPVPAMFAGGEAPPMPADARAGQCYALVRRPQTTTRVVASEPVYETVTERVPLGAPKLVWKPGRGKVERIDHATGQIMCLVEEPAPYETVTRKVVKQQPQSRTVTVPAGPDLLEWRPVLCETNRTPELVRQVQQSLKRQGYDPGPIDGRIGARTITAMNRFQRARSLPVDSDLNLETVRALGIAL